MRDLGRLSLSDETNLAIEAPDTPMHQAALGVLDAAPLLDSSGRLRIDAIREHLAARLDRVPELRRVLWHPGLGRGRSLWVDDPGFRIENHVLVASLPAPGGRARALEFAAQKMSTLMDRSRPLWEVWFLEGYGEREVGLLIKLHHAVADGRAMINLIGQVFDIEPRALEHGTGTWQPAPPPRGGALLYDNLRARVRWVRHVAQRLAHPVALWRSTVSTARGMVEGMRAGRSAPRTSFNRPVGVERKLAVLEVELAGARETAHRYGVKLNDVFQCIVAGALRGVLLARGEKVDGVEIHASMAVSMYASGDESTVGNNIGSMIVRLPLDAGDPSRALERIARAAAHAKASQKAVVTSGLMAVLARSGLTRLYIRHQHMINILTTNLPGPPVPLYFGGARLVDAIAIPPIAGNVTASFAALSYAGRLNLSVIADARAWPDLDVLLAGMRSTWLEVSATEGLTALSA